MDALDVYIVTLNCGRVYIDTTTFASQLFDGRPPNVQLPDLLVLSLQEVAPVPHSLIGGSFLVPYFTRFYNAVDAATEKLGHGKIYTPITTKNVGMTAIMVFARDPMAVQDIETACVGVGTAQMGNKGGVAVRFTYRDPSKPSDTATEMAFVGLHLAAMEGELARRNEDWKNVVRGLVFSSSASPQVQTTTDTEDRPLLSVSSVDASIYKPSSHLFIAGDLNYRTSVLKPGPEDHRTSFPQPATDASSLKHYSKLFLHDQLNQEREAGRTCHGLIEPKVEFPPTYKYNPSQTKVLHDEDLLEWNWAHHRWPSWCDRILYLDVPSWLKAQKPNVKIITRKYTALPLMQTTDHRAVALSLVVPLASIPAPLDTDDADSTDPRISPPFNIDPDWKAKRDWARKREIATGLSMWFTTTYEGASVLVATIAGLIGAIFVLKAVFDS